METPTSVDLVPDRGILEMSEKLAVRGLSLELRVIIDSETDESIAWWSTDENDILALVDIGLA